MLAVTSLAASTYAFWNAHSGGSQLPPKKSLLAYDYHVLFHANHVERLFRKRNTQPTRAVSDIPAERDSRYGSEEAILDIQPI